MAFSGCIKRLVFRCGVMQLHAANAALGLCKFGNPSEEVVLAALRSLRKLNASPSLMQKTRGGIGEGLIRISGFRKLLLTPGSGDWRSLTTQARELGGMFQTFLVRVLVGLMHARALGRAWQCGAVLYAVAGSSSFRVHSRPIQVAMARWSWWRLSASTKSLFVRDVRGS